MSRLALMVDLERCTGCKSCEAACKAEHGLRAGERRNRVLWFTGQEEPEAKQVPTLGFLPLMCQQCDRPACLRACPVAPKAISKDPVTGIVSINESACVGCGECVTACPYGAMGYDAPGHHAVKCDLCTDRRVKEPGTTACASVCPTKAITFGERDELLADAKEQGRHSLDQDVYALEPATVYLDRDGDRSAALSAVLASTPPAVVDSPTPASVLTSQYPFGATASAREPDRVEPGGCNICFNSCTTNFHFRGEHLVKITGNDSDPALQGRICPKSQLTMQLYASEHRLTTPLKRAGERGENKFVPISWQQALDEIAERLKKISAEHGTHATGIFSGTRTGTLTNRGYIRMFSQMFGTPNVESTEPYCSSGKNMAYEMVQGIGGSGNSYTPNDLGAAELYVYIGDNQAETRPVHFGMINDWRLQSGAKMIAIDPRLTVTASKADEYLAIRPGTDLALALALAHYIFAQGLHDETFCREWVIGWEKWRDFINEKGYTPQWAAPITDLSEETIQNLARDIATADGCVIFASRGINQHINSVQANRALMYLAAITGNWGRAGGAFFNMSATTTIGADAPKERRVQPSQPKAATSPIGWADAILDAQPYAMRALIACNNPLSLWPDQKRAREALAALDLLVHIDLFANETSAYADYVLPVATGIEKGEIGRACEDRRIVWIDKMIEPPGQAKPDGWIWIELGKRFGFEDVLKDEWKDSARFWDEALIDNDQMRGCTQKRLHSVPYRWVRAPVATEDAPEIDTLYLEGTTAPGAPQGHRFPTQSGRLEFWTDELEERFANHGLSALPEFYGERETLFDVPHLQSVEPEGDSMLASFTRVPTYGRKARIVATDEATPAKKLRDLGFNLELVTGRPPAPHFHSWTHYSWQAQEMWPDMYAQVHPSTARAAGIRDGEQVEVSTAHGTVVARAWVYPGIRETSVFMPLGWGERQPYNPWQPVNNLTDATQRCPLSEQTNLKSLLCSIRPVEK
ncbi:MAG: molybdopterin-dependent oxidoreductase [Chromatiales bacterium]|jgi:anaerobic selenocysteine-containing dehydrogenase/Fe-S-cluster-containing dehydrogenase component|nr:molybdopterin-dependent oxidoreductase [Chromatiales bacterium]